MTTIKIHVEVDLSDHSVGSVGGWSVEWDTGLDAIALGHRVDILHAAIALFETCTGEEPSGVWFSDDPPRDNWDPGEVGP